jgi:hypothetical protein
MKKATDCCCRVDTRNNIGGCRRLRGTQMKMCVQLSVVEWIGFNTFCTAVITRDADKRQTNKSNNITKDAQSSKKIEIEEKKNGEVGNQGAER